MKKNKLFIAWNIILILFLVGHFTITILYNAPVNPISHKYNYEIQSYMSPLFQQNWKLFAPNPVSNNSSLLVKGIYQEESGVEEQTDWININDHLISELHSNRLTPLRLAVAQTTTSMVEAVNNIGKDKNEYRKLVEDAIEGKGKLPLEMIFLKNISSEALHSKYGREFDEIVIRINIEVFPDYYDYIMGEGTYDKTYIEFQRLPYSQVDKL